ncbi:MAG: TIGR02757 family protein, partial [Campylobacterota bacterium]|nr:TIGR02757 family protein [Campylobacterota bacterium]
MNTKKLLDEEVLKRDSSTELTFDKPDPLIIAKKHNDEYISLICALFAYGNAGQIVKLLLSFDFDLLNQDEKTIAKKLKGYYYRFQSQDDVVAFFIALKRLKKIDSLESIFKVGYDKNQNVMDGIESIISSILNVHDYKSDGYKFLIGKLPKKDKNGDIKLIGNSAYKRYNMFLRWMVRSDNLDMGLWKHIDKKDLILPLDTHTFKVSQKLGLLTRKTADLKSAVLITQKLKEFDNEDPIKYDFAIYRLGQEK